jgi:hypothetical protein
MKTRGDNNELILTSAQTKASGQFQVPASSPPGRVPAEHSEQEAGSVSEPV